MDSCYIEDETADAIIRDIRGMLRPFKIQVFDERNGTGWLRHVLIKRGFATGQVMVVLVAVNPIFKLQKPFLRELLARHPEISTVVQIMKQNFRTGMAVARGMMVVEMDAVILTEYIEFMTHSRENHPACLYGTNVSDIRFPLHSVITQTIFQYAQIKYRIMRYQQTG